MKTVPSHRLSQGSSGPIGHPNLFMIGSAKSGTSHLAALLGQHSDIFLSEPKEPEFFSFDENFDKGFDWYRSIYGDAGNARWVLDASTGYTRYPECPNTVERLHAWAPKAKFIYLMRHPVERAYSHYVHRWSKELHPNEPFRVSFEEHIVDDPICINGSDYQIQLERYLKRYPKQSILCLFNFQLRQNPEAVVRRVCGFLDIDFEDAMMASPGYRSNKSDSFLESRIRLALTDRIKSTPGVGTMIKVLPRSARELGYQWVRRSFLASSTSAEFQPPPMLPKTRAELLKRFEPSVAWVEAFTGVDLARWRR